MTTLTHLPANIVNGPLNPAGQRAGADSGDPQLNTLPVDNGTDASTGIWECQPGGWPVVDRADTEVCFILSGRATLTDDDTGETTEIGAGSFVILPVGWTGRWDVTETVRKAYTIF
ncbi:cupin domain-containing protein [Corynebacterium sp. AOP40-9SA-29]|uniref:cupin domain-containing protein n=1 Tax=Corynebacterium sp. AOP40-9SA-29 TaxID=3457677 RepID=UPI004033A76B